MRNLVFCVLLPVAAGAAGCASSPALVSGAADGATLAARAEVQLSAREARAHVVLDNRGDDPVGVDVDALRLLGGRGERIATSGRVQRFRGSTGEGELRRVPYGVTTVAPASRTELDVDFPRPVGFEPRALVVPSLVRLGIEGQAPIGALIVGLRPDARAAESRRAPFHDPFVDDE